MKIIKTTLMLCASMLALSGTALAADEIILQEVNGEALINQGESYNVASEGMEVLPGDQLMVPADGLAKLIYPNGCVVNVNGEFILTSAAEAPCAAGALLATVGATTATTMSTGGVVLVSLAGAAGLAAIIDDDKNTISE